MWSGGRREIAVMDVVWMKERRGSENLASYGQEENMRNEAMRAGAGRELLWVDASVREKEAKWREEMVKTASEEREEERRRES